MSRPAVTRLKILQSLQKVSQPLGVSDLLKTIKVNKTTIYRELESLKTDGQLVEVDFGDGKKRFELSNRTHHHHMVCDSCHRIECVVLDRDVEILEKEITNKTNFQIQRHKLEFFGVCNDCANLI